MWKVSHSVRLLHSLLSQGADSHSITSTSNSAHLPPNSSSFPSLRTSRTLQSTIRSPFIHCCIHQSLPLPSTFFGTTAVYSFSITWFVLSLLLLNISSPAATRLFLFLLYTPTVNRQPLSSRSLRRRYWHRHFELLYLLPRISRSSFPFARFRPNRLKLPRFI